MKNYSRVLLVVLSFALLLWWTTRASRQLVPVAAVVATMQSGATPRARVTTVRSPVAQSTPQSTPQSVPSSLANARQTLSGAPSWRPSLIGKIAVPAASYVTLSADPGRVSFAVVPSSGDRIYGWLDLTNGDVTRFATRVPRRSGFSNGYRWNYLMGDQVHVLEITDAKGATRSYRARGLYPPQQKDDLPVRVFPQRNRVLMLADGRLLQWDFTTERLIKNSELQADTLARDGKTFATLGEIGDVASGAITKTIPWRTEGSMEYEYFSSYGRYCLLDSRDGTFRVVEIATGKALWRFPADNIFNLDALMSDDEKTIFVHAGRHWQARNFRTGAISRRLDYLPDLDAAALSPDGATLYSFASGRLYRQRAR